MLAVGISAEALATAALSFFFRGLIVADGGLSVAEENKIHILIYKMRNQLPGNDAEMVENLTKLREDLSYANWTPDQFCDEALRYFDGFVKTGSANHSHIDGILDMLEIIMEVGTVTEGEKKYLNRVDNEFAERYPELA